MSFKEQLIDILREEGYDFIFAAEIATDALKRIKANPSDEGKLIIRATGREIHWKRPKGNPPHSTAEIYDKIISIQAQKGKRSLWPKGFFKHDFQKDKTSASIYGLPDGSLLIRSKKGKRLWNRFSYGPEDL